MDKTSTEKSFYYTDVVAAALVACLAFACRFLNWYGFFYEKVSLKSDLYLFRNFGPYGPIGVEDGKEIGIDRLGAKLEKVEILLTVCTVLSLLYLAVIIAQIFVPKLREGVIPFILGLVFYGLLFATVIFAFFAAVDSMEVYSNTEVTVSIGWYTALMVSLLGIALTASPKLVSGLLFKDE